MFAQGQLLGMQSDLLNRLKTEINAWDKVAEKHPYSVYRRNDYPAYVAKQVIRFVKELRLFVGGIFSAPRAMLSWDVTRRLPRPTRIRRTLR